jgi:hypothetical protein
MSLNIQAPLSRILNCPAIRRQARFNPGACAAAALAGPPKQPDYTKLRKKMGKTGN